MPVIHGIDCNLFFFKQFKSGVKTESMVQVVMGKKNFNFFPALQKLPAGRLHKSKKSAARIKNDQLVINWNDIASRLPAET